MPKISIIIVNWNGLKDTIECLQSLKKITYPNYEVILVDNGSRNDEARILKEKFGNYISLIEGKINVGFAEGNNIGIRQAIKNKADFVLCLNNDVIVEPDFLDKAVSVALLNKVDMVACKMCSFDKTKIDNLGIQFMKSGLSFNILDDSYGKYLFAPCGGCALYSIKMLKDIQQDNDFFDKFFFCYSEDLDLGFRARLKKYDCVLSNDSVVYHKGGASSKHLSNFHVYYNQRNILACLIKNLPVSLFFRNSLWIFMMQLGLLIVSVKRFSFLPFLMANINIIRNFYILLIKRRNIQLSKKITASDLNKKITPHILIKSYLINAFKK